MTEKTRASLLGLISLVLLLIGSSNVQAEEKTFSMTAPAEYTNGDPLAVDEIEATTVHCGDTDGGPYAPVVSSSGFAGELVADFTDGGFYCVATVTANGTQSGPSNQVFFTIDRQPNAPVLSVD